MSKSLDRLGLLETFIRIADRGSISAAARDLGLSQASASRQLRELEARLGASLATRTTHDFALTPAGTALLADARIAISNWEALEERHAGDDEVRGRLRIIAPIALGQTILADLAVAFQAQHPKLSIDWALRDGTIRFAEEGCDLWIKIGPVPDETLVVRPLAHVERLLVASPALLREAPIDDLNSAERAPLAALEPLEGGEIPLSTRDGRRASIRPPVRFTTNNIVALRRAALAGIGAAVMPRWFVHDDLRRGDLVDRLPEWRAPELPVSVAFPPAERRPRRVSAFIAALEAFFAGWMTG